jgi:hypothetical protein
MHADDELALQTVLLFICVSRFRVNDGKFALLDSLIASSTFEYRQQQLLIYHSTTLDELVLTCLGQHLAGNTDRLLTPAWLVGHPNFVSGEEYPRVLKPTVRGFCGIRRREYEVFCRGEDIHIIAVFMQASHALGEC